MAESHSSFSNYKVDELLGANFVPVVASCRQSVSERRVLLAAWVWNKFEPVISVKGSSYFAWQFEKYINNSTLILE